MKTRSMLGLLVVFFGLYLGLATPAGAAAKCPADSVKVGPVCVDKFEASVWEIPNVPANKGLINKVKKGTATLANLTSASAIANGVVQRGVASDDYGAGCPDTGNGCRDFYAVSIPGVRPSGVHHLVSGAAGRYELREETFDQCRVAGCGFGDAGPGVVCRRIARLQYE